MDANSVLAGSSEGGGAGDEQTGMVPGSGAREVSRTGGGEGRGVVD